MIEVDGKLLVCQRRRGDTFGLMWEFPGGKMQAGESAVEALARELREELGVDGAVGAEVPRHRYAEVSEERGWAERAIRERTDARVEELEELNFCPRIGSWWASFAARDCGSCQA